MFSSSFQVVAKYQNVKGEPFGDLKIFLKNLCRKKWKGVPSNLVWFCMLRKNWNE